MKRFSFILTGGRLTGLCAALALAVSATNVVAQNDNPRPAGQGDGGGRQGGGPGGPGGPGGRGGFDPAQMQQRMMDGVRRELDFKDDTEWKAVQPLVQKVFDTRVQNGGGMGRLFGGGRNRNGDQGGGNNGGNRRGGGMFGNPGPEAEALQKAIDDNAPSGQIKDLLAKYKSAQKTKQDKHEEAQADLRKVLSVKQEAAATLLGLLN